MMNLKFKLAKFLLSLTLYIYIYIYVYKGRLRWECEPCSAHLRRLLSAALHLEPRLRLNSLPHAYTERGWLLVQLGLTHQHPRDNKTNALLRGGRLHPRGRHAEAVRNAHAARRPSDHARQREVPGTRGSVQAESVLLGLARAARDRVQVDHEEWHRS